MHILRCFLPFYLDRDSGLAARRLKALRTKLAEELVNKRTYGGNEVLNLYLSSLFLFATYICLLTVVV
jgi:hypothetical protein